MQQKKTKRVVLKFEANHLSLLETNEFFPSCFDRCWIVGEKRVYGINERAKKSNKIEMINIQNTMCEKKKKYTKTHV